MYVKEEEKSSYLRSLSAQVALKSLKKFPQRTHKKYDKELRDETKIMKEWTLMKSKQNQIT